jgi:16S rRNA (cytidine1402-2'-O)-methyltransferase
MFVNMLGTLYVIATPIGNLKDITLRALEVLSAVDFVIAEDTRVTKKLLSHYDIQKPFISIHAHSKEGAYEKVLEHFANGKKLGLVTDAGTPCISDPGVVVVDLIRKKFVDNIPDIICVPGASAITTALSISGVYADRFTFVGYPPHKKGRDKFFSNLVDIKIKPIVIYESTHRLIKTITDLEKVFFSDKEIVIAKELTKIYEEVWRGMIKESKEYFVGKKLKGEFVVIVP